MTMPAASTQGSRVLNEKRDYQRILPDYKARKELREQGFTWVLSSNVSAVRATQGNLYIRFHNGSVYEYPRMGGRYEDILNAESKGRWVWNELRRKNVPYSKIGAMPMDDDLDLTDEEVMSVGITVQELRRLEAVTLATLATTKTLGELAISTSTIPLLR